MKFHRVILILAGILSLPSAYGADNAPRFIWGANGHPFVQEGYRPDMNGVGYEEQMKLLAELGMSYYRTDIGLRESESYRWDWLDRLIKLGNKYNVKILPVIFPSVNLSKEIKKHPVDLKGIYKTSFNETKKFVERFREQIDVYEMHNELDAWCINVNFWGKGNAPNGDKVKHYYPDRLKVVSAMLRGISDAIHSANPKAKRMLNTGGWLHTGFVKAMIDEGVRFDILAWHWYSDMGKIDGIEIRNNYDLLAELNKFGKPIWITEGNFRPGLRKGKWSSGEGGGISEGCSYLRETLTHFYQLRKRGIEAYFIYELLDEPYHAIRLPGNREAYYGLVELKRTDNGKGWEIAKRKPAFYVVKKVIESCTDR